MILFRSNQRTLEGTVMVWYPSDSNDGELVQVVFDDKSASTTLTVGEFNQSRAAYIAVHPYDKTISEEAKERRDNERRDRGVGRGVGSRGGRGGRGTQLAEISPPPPPPTANQQQPAAVLPASSLAAILPASSSTSLALTNIAGGGDSSSRGPIPSANQHSGKAVFVCYSAVIV